MKSRHLIGTGALAVALSLLGAQGLSGQETHENPLPHFLFPSFQEGVIIMKAGKPSSSLINYNLLEERMITESNGTYRYLKDPKFIDTIYISDRVFIPVEEIFYEILSDGKYTLYLQNRATFAPTGQEVGYGVKSQTTGPTRFKRYELNKSWGEVAHMDLNADGEIRLSPIYWIMREGELKKFINGKQFIRLFPEYSKKLQGFLGKENINFKSREDIIRLGNYLNTLTGGE